MVTQDKNNTTLNGASSYDAQLNAARQKVSDDSLLSALSLVIRANVEYAKGVTDLISCDLEREDKLDEIRDDLTKLVSKTEQLIVSQEILLKAISSKNIEDQKYLDKKLGPLYKGAGLKEDGTEYAPADKWVVKLTDAIQSRLFMIITGAILFLVAKIILSGLIDKVVK